MELHARTRVRLRSNEGYSTIVRTKEMGTRPIRTQSNVTVLHIQLSRVPPSDY